MYILDLFCGSYSKTTSHHIQAENIFMCTDDHQMYTIGDSIENSAQDLKEETEITRWYKGNLLKANPTEFRIIAIYQKPSKTRVCR